MGEFEQSIARASSNPDSVLGIFDKLGIKSLSHYVEKVALYATKVKEDAYANDFDAQQNSMTVDPAYQADADAQLNSVNQLTPAQQNDFDAQSHSATTLTPEMQSDVDAQMNSAADMDNQMNNVDMMRTKNLPPDLGVMQTIKNMMVNIGDGVMDAIRKGLEMVKGLLANANSALGQMVPGTSFSYAALLGISLIASIVGFALYKIIKFIRNRRQEATAEGLTDTYKGIRNALKEGMDVNNALYEMTLQENFVSDTIAGIAERAQNVGHALANFVVGESSDSDSWFKKAFRAASMFIILCGVVALGIFAYNKYEAFAATNQMDNLDSQRQANTIANMTPELGKIDMARQDNMQANQFNRHEPQMDALDLQRQAQAIAQQTPGAMAQADELDRQRNLQSAMRTNRS